ncbi:MAG: crotonase/enoyl-CoA hydratase family protein [Panacagrimonas sp.]
MNPIAAPSYSTLSLQLEGHVAWLRLNRPDRGNALDQAMWDELPQALGWLDRLPGLRVVVLAGAGKNFCGGIDLSVLDRERNNMLGNPCPTRGRENFLGFIESAQASFNAIEKLRVPVIAAIHGACYGGGVDLIAACDLRICTADTRFCIKEVDVAIVPDVGTVQRLRHVIGYSNVAELTYTAETFDGRRARELGLVSRVCDSVEALQASAAELAAVIAAKSPVTVRGIKRNLLFSRDHSVTDGLAYAAAWNAGMLVGSDLDEAIASHREKRPGRFLG